MKKLILSAAMVVFFAFSASAQNLKSNIKQSDSGNYEQVSTRSRSVDKGTPTGKTFKTSKGVVFDVLQSKKGRLFIVRVSGKTGNEYKQYLDKKD